MLCSCVCNMTRPPDGVNAIMEDKASPRTEVVHQLLSWCDDNLDWFVASFLWLCKLLRPVDLLTCL
eukprot:m.167210 g.167210  ORF g.167210 m.167210 type:complete len:66 (-) comp16634_c0_seq12:488-685(-)